MDKGDAQRKPEGPYCQVVRIFSQTETCPWLYTGLGPKKPTCLKLNKRLSWNRAGKILKECE